MTTLAQSDSEQSNSEQSNSKHSNTEQWTIVLDELERRVRSGETSLDNGEPLEPFLLEPYQAPGDLGPMPEAMFERALELLEMHADIEDRIRAAMSTLQQQIAATNSAKKASAFGETNIPKFVDYGA
jgi:hypothetical protein